MSSNYKIPVYQVRLVRDGSVSRDERQVSTPNSAVAIIAPFFDGFDREGLFVLLLNLKNRVIGVNMVSLGTIDSAPCSVGNVFKPALLCNAAAIIVAHNHPSGEPTPSPEDCRLTEKIVEAGKLLDVQVLDHLIIGDEGRFYSFREHGYI